MDTADNLARVLTLPRTGRTAIFGMTGAGKTLLGDTLRTAWMQRYQNGKVLILDTKPHYRAEWMLNGVKANLLYKKWDTSNIHDYVPGSIVLPYETNITHMLKMAYKKTNTVIAQGPKFYWKWILEVARTFYEHFSNKQGPRLIDVDEAADFFEVDRWGGIILQSLRAGRQLGLGIMMGSQRPVFLPKASLTESDRLYLLKLKNEEDLKTIQKNGGLPKWIHAPQRFYEFIYYDFYKPEYPSGGLFKLGGIE